MRIVRFEAFELAGSFEKWICARPPQAVVLWLILTLCLLSECYRAVYCDIIA